MKSTTAYLVHLSDPVREMAMQAAREVFPRGQLVPVRTVGEAIQLPGQGRQLLVLGDTSEEDIGLASQALDANELPRWAVVHLGQNASDLVDTVSPEDCNVRVLARIFHSAVQHQELLRENLQLRGDLKTLSRRFNHDMRTPLGCIDTLCSLLQEQPTTDVRSLKETISAIRGSTAEISALLDRVSFVLKASAEPLPVSLLSMGPVVQKVVTAVTAAHERQRVKISQPPVWPEVKGVEAWLDFIWTNLIQNALKHGQGRSIQLGWEPKGTDLRFWVSNEGAVPPALRGNLLKPFHLLHQRTSAGLGLSLVERMVALHGGRSGYESTPDNHALFYFTLPAGTLVARPGGVGIPQQKLAESRAT